MLEVINDELGSFAVVTNKSGSAWLFWWAVAALALLILLYVLPNSIRSILASPETNIIVRILSAGIFLAVVLGFYLRMFFECGFWPDVQRRGMWLALFILLPILSAFIYFVATRFCYLRRILN